MAVQQIDWEKAWAAFWSRYEREAPRMFRAQQLSAEAFKELWHRISPVVGLDETIGISLDKDGGLRTSMAGWVLIGAIAFAGADMAMKGFEERLAAVEEWCGIKRPSLNEETKPKKKGD